MSDDNMIKAICTEIAAWSVFSAQDIYDAWKLCRSFDMILAAMDYCAIFGYVNLSMQVKRIKKTMQELNKQ
jgi:hypothetical protein